VPFSRCLNFQNFFFSLFIDFAMTPPLQGPLQDYFDFLIFFVTTWEEVSVFSTLASYVSTCNPIFDVQTNFKLQKLSSIH